jgi:hypothetical protein
MILRNNICLRSKNVNIMIIIHSCCNNIVSYYNHLSNVCCIPFTTPIDDSLNILGWALGTKVVLPFLFVFLCKLYIYS